MGYEIELREQGYAPRAAREFGVRPDGVFAYGRHWPRIHPSAFVTPGTYIIGAYDLIWAKAHYGVDWRERYRMVDTIGYSIYVFKVP